nr:hypothetical protein [Bacteroidota bacterium]
MIVEKESKNINDRTWCFWENENGLWDKIITKSWSTGFFITKEKSIKLDMKNYHYKMLRGIDFYNHAKSKISSTENISWINDDVKSVQEKRVAMSPSIAVTKNILPCMFSIAECRKIILHQTILTLLFSNISKVG